MTNDTTRIEPELAPRAVLGVPITPWMEGHSTGMAKGREAELAAVIAELERMLGVCEYDEVSAFIPLLITRLRNGGHHA